MRTLVTIVKHKKQTGQKLYTVEGSKGEALWQILAMPKITELIIATLNRICWHIILNF